MNRRHSMDVNDELNYLAKLARGEHRSYEILFTYYHPKVYHFISGFVKDEEAYDITQDIFCKVWQNREKMAAISSFKSYLFAMARNAIYNQYEHQLIVQKYSSLSDENKNEYTLEDELQAKELYLLIEMYVEHMPEQRGRIFKMSRMEGFSNEEIAEKLHLSKGTVENNISIALAELRKFILIFICLRHILFNILPEILEKTKWS